METILEQLKSNSQHHPNHIAFESWATGKSLSNEGLLAQAQNTAAALKNVVKPETPAFFIFSAGLDCVIAYYACLFSGVIPIPYPSPPGNLKRATHYWNELTTTAAALNSHCIFCDDKSKKILSQLNTAQHFTLHSLSDFKLHNPTEALPERGPEDHAHIQLTSGSTGIPKGVSLNHRQLFNNPSTLIKHTEEAAQLNVVNWLPHYHDLGLVIGLLIGPILAGKTVILDPASWATDPISWFKAISSTKHALSGAPNFALQRCIDRIQPDELTDIDLSTWQILFTGAEAIQEKVLHEFSKRFACCHLPAKLFKPGYGLAESTSCIATVEKNRVVKECFQGFASDAIQRDTVIEDTESDYRLASNGSPIPGTELIIVDPESHALLSPNKIGEIWLKGNCVANGYWNNPEATTEIFQATTSTGDGPFLRTGDKGFMHKGELFIVSRLKDLIIIHGKNYSPGKIEESAQGSYPALITLAVAFSVWNEEHQAEELTLLIECKRHRTLPLLSDLSCTLSANILAETGCKLHVLCLLSSRQIPLTSSGKVKRLEAKRAYQQKELDTLITVQGGDNITHHLSENLLTKYLKLNEKEKT